MTSITEDHERSEYVAGLRALADLLEQQPDLELPDSGRVGSMSLCVGDREQMLSWARVLEAVREETSKTQSLHYLYGQVRGLRFKIFGGVSVVGGIKTRTVMQPVDLYEVPSLLAEAIDR